MLFLQQFDSHFCFKSCLPTTSTAKLSAMSNSKRSWSTATAKSSAARPVSPSAITGSKASVIAITEQDVYKQIEHITPAAFYYHEKFYFVDSLFVTKKGDGYQVEAYSKPWGTCPRTHLQGDVWYTSIDPIPYTTPHGRMFDDFDSAIRYYYDFQPEHMSIVPKVDFKTVTVDLVHQSQNRIETSVDNAISTMAKLVSQMVKLTIVIIILVIIF